MKNFLLLALLATTSIPAFARDSRHFVCTGFMSAKPGPDNYGFAIQLDEGRASDGVGRKEVLSSVWAGKLYQGSRLNKQLDVGQDGMIAMIAPGTKNKVFFTGHYNLMSDAKTATYKLQLQGAFNTEPTNPASKESIATVLDCTDLSN